MAVADTKGQWTDRIPGTENMVQQKRTDIEINGTIKGAGRKSMICTGVVIPKHFAIFAVIRCALPVSTLAAERRPGSS